MKISKELEKKIARSINAKYEKDEAKLNDQKKKIIEEQTVKAAKEIEDAARSYPSLDRFLKTKLYNERTISEFVNRRPSEFIDTKSYSHISSAIETIKTQKEREAENLMIAISYEKDIEGIKKAFSDLGFEF